jgi:hypothetical protein
MSECRGVELFIQKITDMSNDNQDEVTDHELGLRKVGGSLPDVCSDQDKVGWAGLVGWMNRFIGVPLAYQSNSSGPPKQLT